MTVSPLDPDVVAEVRRLVRDERSAAEVWRLVRPALEPRGLPVPSYSSVRRIVADERSRRALEPTGESDFPLRVELYPGRFSIR